jgi:hypothetical protein
MAQQREEWREEEMKRSNHFQSSLEVLDYMLVGVGMVACVVECG